MATRTERLLTGGPGAGPVGYLRTAAIRPGTDTIDTFVSPRGTGALSRGDGTWLVRTRQQIGARRWELTDTWFDSSGRMTARQYSRTARGSLAIDLEAVRADGDSASLLVTGDRVTAWVVPEGQGPQLFDAPNVTERFATGAIVAAIAAARPVVGAVFVAPTHSLYGGNPVATRLDSIRVVRRDTLRAGTTPVPVLVLERRGGGLTWVDEASGTIVAARGNAGPQQWWWHIRRGFAPPRIE
jgi:hypothetical protein